MTPAAELSRVLIVLASSGASTHPLPASGRVTIGRSRNNDVCIDDRSISRHHAILHVGAGVSVEDLGSANGTHIRDMTAPASAVPGGSATEPHHDVRVSPRTRCALEPGQLLLLGSVLIAVRPAETPPEARSGAERRGRPMIVCDPAMVELVRLADLAAAGTIPVLLLGETGVGKEVFAERIVGRSPRAAQPFVRLNCSALSETLLESELFGHERGAFTGALQTKRGLLEAADGGTVFLDEIGELPLPLQAKLLRVVEEGSVLRVGATKPRAVDIRYIAATNRDLESEIDAGTFRRDLYFRLSGVALHIPPLRERITEIEPLARATLDALAQRAGLEKPPDIHPDAVKLLERHSWPGNVRELRNMMERALLLCGGGPILPSHLAIAIRSPDSTERVSLSGPSAATLETIPPAPGASEVELRDRLDQIERERIVQALEHCGGNQTRAAIALGISRGTLVARIAAYGLPRPKKGR